MGATASSGTTHAEGDRPAVRLEVDATTRVGSIVLDRPPLNALDLSVWEELAHVVADVGARDDVRAILVRGDHRAFAVGVDVAEARSWDPQTAFAASGRMQDVTTALAELPQVSIAVVSGYVLGGGCGIALACDFRFAADNAKIGLPEVLYGAMPGAGETQRLARLIGVGRAKELLFTGRMVDMVEAPTIGLVDHVLPADDVVAAATAAAEGFAAGPASLALIKRAIDEGSSLSLHDGLLLERRLLAEAFATGDFAAGSAAFLSDGPGAARFDGRHR